MLNLLLGLAAATAAVTPAQAASSKASSEVRCVASAYASSTSYSKDAFVKIGADFGLYICKGDVSIDIKKRQEDVAKAIAEAVAATSIDCTIKGDGSASASAIAHAEANATASAEAMGEGFVSIETCTGCKAALEVLVEASKTVFVEAIAHSEAKLLDFRGASGQEKRELRGEVIEDLKKEILPTFAEIILEVDRKVKDGEETCGVSVEACAVAGSELGCCDITLNNAATSISTDAVAIAGSSAEAEKASCGDDEELAAYSSAVAVATADAYAKALTEVHGWCKSTQEASACGFGEASVVAVAHAQATAWAEAYARAANKCGCEIEITSLADAVEHIFVKATSDLIVDICTDGDAFAHLDVVQESVSEDHVTAIAAAISEAVAGSDSCRATTSACSYAGESYACCTITVDNAADAYAEDAFVGIEGDAAVYLCTPGEAETQLDIVASAFGRAWAKVITAVNGYCISSGYASACSLVDSHIRAVAHAQAHAFASLWAGTVDDPEHCGCQINVDAVAESITDILVEATLHVFGEICVEDEDFVEVDLFLQAFEENNFEAFAELFVYLKKTIHDAESSECQLDAVVVAGVDETTVTGVCSDCKGKNQHCMNTVREGLDADGNPIVHGCCDVSQHCVKINDRRAKCYDVDKDPKSSWDGEVLGCTQ